MTLGLFRNPIIHHRKSVKKHSQRKMAEVPLEFEGKSLYEIFGVNRDASAEKIRKAYYKLALQWHPDKNSTKEATSKFQFLSKAHSVLSDPEKRSAYDEFGILDDIIEAQDANWQEYWRCLFPRVTINKIEEFSKQFRYSEEEKEAVLNAYTEFKGNMDEIIDAVMLSTEEDRERFNVMIESAIEEGKLQNFDQPSNLSSKKGKRKKRRVDESKEAEELAKELNLHSASSNELADLVRQNHEKRSMSLLDALEAKYCKPAKKEEKSSKSAKRKSKKNAKKNA